MSDDIVLIIGAVASIVGLICVHLFWKPARKDNEPESVKPEFGALIQLSEDLQRDLNVKTEANWKDIPELFKRETWCRQYRVDSEDTEETVKARFAIYNKELDDAMKEMAMRFFRDHRSQWWIQYEQKQITERK